MLNHQKKWDFVLQGEGLTGRWSVLFKVKVPGDREMDLSTLEAH